MRIITAYISTSQVLSDICHSLRWSDVFNPQAHKKQFTYALNSVT